MNKKPTLKSLAQELETLKAAKAKRQVSDNHTHNPNNDVAGHDIKNSYINRLYLKSSMLYLYIFTGILGYATRIPFFKKLIGLLGLWYGKTTIWKILVRLRKIFIIFNSIIGVYMVYKSVGFSPDNVLAGFVGMGHTYLEMFASLTRRLFNWFFELFDYKIVPNIPGEPTIPKTGYNWRSGISGDPIDRNVLTNPFHTTWEDLKKKDSLRESYKSLFNININSNPTPWYKDISTWLWIGGIITSIGAIYFGYKLIFDIDPSTPKAGTVEPPTDINLTDMRSSKNPLSHIGSQAKNIGNGLAYYTTIVINKINPYNYFVSSNELNAQFQEFMHKQCRPETAYFKLYPFTEYNPNVPWYNKLKYAVWGESALESLERFKHKFLADRVYNSLKVTNNVFSDVAGMTPS